MSNSEFNPLIAPKKDGLLALKSPNWILNPLKTLGNYLEVYSRLLPSDYKHLIYLELSSGTGFVEIQHTGENVYDSGLLAMASPIPFSRYILWEPDESYAQALRVRINRYFKDQNVLILNGGLENLPGLLKKYIPVGNHGSKSWIFCNLNPRFGIPQMAFLDSILSLDPVIFFALSNEKKSFWSKIKGQKAGRENQVRSQIKSLEKWAQESNFQLKGNYYSTSIQKMTTLCYEGILLRRIKGKKVISEVRRKTSNQIQLFS